MAFIADSSVPLLLQLVCMPKPSTRTSGRAPLRYKKNSMLLMLLILAAVAISYKIFAITTNFKNDANDSAAAAKKPATAQQKPVESYVPVLDRNQNAIPLEEKAPTATENGVHISSGYRFEYPADFTIDTYEVGSGPSSRWETYLWKDDLSMNLNFKRYMAYFNADGSYVPSCFDTESIGQRMISNQAWDEFFLPSGYGDGGGTPQAHSIYCVSILQDKVVTEVRITADGHQTIEWFRTNSALNTVLNSFQLQ